jgi:hypothetical protein
MECAHGLVLLVKLDVIRLERSFADALHVPKVELLKVTGQSGRGGQIGSKIWQTYWFS